MTARSIGTLQYVSHQIDNSMVTKPVEDLVTGSIHIQKVCFNYFLFWVIATIVPLLCAPPTYGMPLPLNQARFLITEIIKY